MNLVPVTTVNHFVPSYLETLNRLWFGMLNAGPNAPLVVVHCAIFLADYLFYAVPLVLLAYWFRGNDDQKRLALKAVAVALVAIGLAQIVGYFYPHPRPFMVGVGRTLMTHIADPSFPSDHMTVFGAVGWTFVLARVFGIGALLFVLGLLIAWARVYLGVHFPFDMLGAVLLSLLVALAMEPLWKIYGVAFSRPFIILSHKILQFFKLTS